jgi:hypothetical protein
MIKWSFFSSYYDLIILISFTGMPRLQAPALLLKGIHLTGRSLGKTRANAGNWVMQTRKILSSAAASSDLLYAYTEWTVPT